MAQDEPVCKYSDLDITLWDCEGETEEVYYGEEMIGYKTYCNTCREAKEQVFEFTCQDAHCFGDHTIRLTGGEVAFHHRKMKEGDWTFPPLRCSACRDWLRTAGQVKSECAACKRSFVIPVGVLKNIKKYEGDPETHKPEFCPRCAAMTEEERQAMIEERQYYDKAYRELKPLFKREEDPVFGGHMIPAATFFYVQDDRLVPSIDLILTNIAAEALSNLLDQEPNPMPARSGPADVAFYKSSTTNELQSWVDPRGNFHIQRDEKSNPVTVRVTREQHFLKHKDEFNPKVDSPEEVLKIADKIVTCNEKGRIANFNDTKNNTMIKVDLKTGHMVAFAKDTGHYLSVRPMVAFTATPDPIDLTKAIMSQQRWVA